MQSNAEIMLSHSWADDAEELLHAVEMYAGRCMLVDDVQIWFCCFSIYQCQDGAGPSIAEQLSLMPFQDNHHYHVYSLSNTGALDNI